MKIIYYLLVLTSSLLSSQNFNIKIENFENKGSTLIVNYSIQNLLSASQYLVVNPEGLETYFDPDEYSYNLDGFNNTRKNLFSPRIVLYDRNKDVVKIDFFSFTSPVDSVEQKMFEEYNLQLTKKRKTLFTS